jgi:hypothetical protein
MINDNKFLRGRHFFLTYPNIEVLDYATIIESIKNSKDFISKLSTSSIPMEIIPKPVMEKNSLEKGIENSGVLGVSDESFLNPKFNLEKYQEKLWRKSTNTSSP